MSTKYVLYSCPYCGNFSGKKTCTHCRNLLYERRDMYTTGAINTLSVRKECDEKLTEKIAKHNEKAENKISAFIEKRFETPKKSDTNYNADEIVSDNTILINYLRALVCSEGRVYALSSIYIEICKQAENSVLIDDYNANAVKELLDKNTKPQKKTKPNDDKAKIQRLLETELEKEGIEKPDKPIEPKKEEFITVKIVAAPPVPSEPIYAKPGLFNKKRVEEQNKAKKLVFEKELRIYSEAKERAEKSEVEYQKQLQNYNDALQEYQNSIKKYNKELAEYRAKSNEIKKNISSRLAAEQESREASEKLLLQQNKETRAQVASEAISTFLNYKKTTFLKTQKKSIEEKLIQTISECRALRAANVLYPKYQTLVAEAKILEYLESKRCDTLTGENGAYNIYESEIRSGIVNPLLDQLLLQIETMKISKTVLFMELSKMSDFINDTKANLNKAVEALSTKTTNVNLAKKWFEEEQEGHHPQIELSIPNQKKVDNFECTLQKDFADSSTEFQKTESNLPRYK